MDKNSKFKTGLSIHGIVYPKPVSAFSESEKHQIIEEFLNSGCTKQQIWKKYTGQSEEHGELLGWMRKLGYATSPKIRRSNIAQTPPLMAGRKKAGNQDYEDFEALQLKKRIADLEVQLKEAQMKAIAFSTMVDIAEKEFNIPIRKKYNTKPSKK